VSRGGITGILDTIYYPRKIGVRGKYCLEEV